MTIEKIADWIGYWDRASMGPRIDLIQSFDDLVICRRFNRSMNGGVMWNVSNEEMWAALAVHRKRLAA